ncbi:hypothetical protein C0Q70_08891 [Pomacea canaliculata]|uniref:Uncharacterized protein n=1 Tax=Pomacea canaliculata TaxID=400727 RepID=A0A2T7P8B0_POMCA|nr:hypothetical protein C0Q70_08891 [Pomacea canaliculata]
MCPPTTRLHVYHKCTNLDPSALGIGLRSSRSVTAGGAELDCGCTPTESRGQGEEEVRRRRERDSLDLSSEV